MTILAVPSFFAILDFLAADVRRFFVQTLTELSCKSAGIPVLKGNIFWQPYKKRFSEPPFFWRIVKIPRRRLTSGKKQGIIGTNSIDPAIRRSNGRGAASQKYSVHDGIQVPDERKGTVAEAETDLKSRFSLGRRKRSGGLSQKCGELSLAESFRASTRKPYYLVMKP